MNKDAQTDRALLKEIKKRWSPRAFSSRSVDKNILIDIIEAARWSASGYNEQPWRFIVGIKGKGAAWQKIYEALMDMNQLWCRNAPVLLLMTAKKTFTHNGSPNPWYQYDLGQTAAYISMQAMKNEIYVHQLGGLDTKKAQESFNIPEDFEALTAMALGYLGNADDLPQNLKEMELRERTRKGLETIVYSEKWDEKSELLFD